MADTGWYPDPGGSGQFRYWDGRSWSPQLSPHPSAPPPGQTGPTPQRGRRRGAAGAVIGLVAVLVAAAVVVLLVVRPWSGVKDITDNPPVNTVSPGDDGASPTPTPSPTPSPTPTPTPSAKTPQGRVACPEGDPYARDQHPTDDRTHGGGLSFATLPDWDVDPQVGGLSFAYDVSSNAYQVADSWFALSAVGALRIADGFDDPQHSATAVVQCISTTSFYENLRSIEPVHSKAVTVDGHPGWSIRAKFLCDVEGHPEIKGDLVDVIVVDVDGGESLGLYLGTATIDDRTTTAAMEAAITSLQVDG